MGAMPMSRAMRFASMAVACVTMSAAGASPGAGAAAPADVLPRILVFSRTAGFRHDSIPDGIRCLKEIGATRWQVDATEDPAAFTAERLRGYRAVVFLSTTGDVLDRPQEEAFEGYIRAGGGFAGIHAATDTEYGWEWFGRLVGGRFATHPPVQPAVVRVEDRAHRSTRMLPAEWRRTDEWYAFRENPRAGGVHVLATLDETTFDPGKAAMGTDHPICWCRTFDGGRSWYTAGGHTKESFEEPLFRQHLAEGIAWAAGLPEPKAALPREAPVLAGAAPILAAGLGGLIVIGAPVIALVALIPTSRTGWKAPTLAFLLPGAGHLSLGYRRRGLLAMTALLLMFASGLFVGGVDAVDHEEDGPWFMAQSMYGPLAYGADWANRALLKSGKVGELLPTPPATDALGRPLPGKATVSSLRGVGAANEFGTLFIALGGLMNLILAMDCARREPAERPDR
jgi:type 1 glutamine amidotransferase